MFKPFLSKIIAEAHARAKIDHAGERADPPMFRAPRPYSYFLGLQMANGFAEYRAKLTGMVPTSTAPEPRRLWA